LGHYEYNDWIGSILREYVLVIFGKFGFEKKSQKNNNQNVDFWGVMGIYVGIVNGNGL
jgi:hypothetical protein